MNNVKLLQIPSQQSTDLIQLDSMYPMTVEDFDPLKNPSVLAYQNQNQSKPLLYQNSTSFNNNFSASTAQPSTSSSMYRKPPARNPYSPPTQDRNTDADHELLRRFGLDNLKLNDNHRNTTSNTVTTTTTAATASNINDAFIPNSNNFNRIHSTDSGLHQTKGNSKYQWTTFD